jgi:pimeloyl-ACP methyl ester carboxylesterase
LTAKHSLRPGDGVVIGHVPFVSRVDSETDVQEATGFFGHYEHKLFGCTYVPAGGTSVGLVICPPLLAESLKSYRREVLLARSLAARGVAVQRFHYRGAGQSQGDPRMITIDRMHEDALAAVDQLIDRSGVSRLAFLGTRWGAVVAAGIARRHREAPLALWDPVVEGNRYVRELLRGRLISDLKHRGEKNTSTSRLLDELKASGSVEILGYGLTHNLVADLASHSLEDEIGIDPRHLLLIQVELGERLRPDYRSLVERLSAVGFPIQTRILSYEQAWWFGGGSWEMEQEPALTEALLTVTGAWVASSFPQVVTLHDDRILGG